MSDKHKKKPKRLRIFHAKRTTRKGGIVGKKRGRQVLPGCYDMPAGRKPNGAYEWDTATGTFLSTLLSAFQRTLRLKNF